MIIDYSITNYRSIRERQTLYLLAKRKKNDNQENKVFSYSKMKGFKSILSKGCAIYGHNASGKSNLLRGFYFFSDFITDSQRDIKPSNKIPVIPFLLDDESRKKDSEFEVNFIIDDVRYNYEIKLNSTRVTFESMKAYPNAIAQDWYTRIWNIEKNDYDWSSGDAQKYGFDEAKASKTRENVSFLSFANEEKNDVLKKIYDWFKSIAIFNGDLEEFSEIFTASEAEQAGINREKVLDFIKCADIGIQNLKLNKKEFNVSELPGFLSQDIKDKMISELTGKFRIESTFEHNGSNDKLYPIEFKDESEGTRKLYKLLGSIFNILEEGGILFFDEIENSLHPLLLIEVLKLFFSDLHNPKGAQIIFTVHDTILLDVDLLNRDQIWFTEKDLSGASKVYPLLEYSPRRMESLIRGYLSGRYGAIKNFDRRCFDKKIIEFNKNKTDVK